MYKYSGEQSLPLDYSFLLFIYNLIHQLYSFKHVDIRTTTHITSKDIWYQVRQLDPTSYLSTLCTAGLNNNACASTLR